MHVAVAVKLLKIKINNNTRGLRSRNFYTCPGKKLQALGLGNLTRVQVRETPGLRSRNFNTCPGKKHQALGLGKL
jgi:hypothetical protein